MKYLIRVAFAALSLATIAPVANAALVGDHSTIAGDRGATLMQQSGGGGLAGGGN